MYFTEIFTVTNIKSFDFNYFKFLVYLILTNNQYNIYIYSLCVYKKTYQIE